MIEWALWICLTGPSRECARNPGTYATQELCLTAANITPYVYKELPVRGECRPDTSGRK